MKEYIIHINDTHQHLNLTFFPKSHSYAFVNGIEIVSIPNDLYFKGENASIPTSSTSPYFLNRDKSLETLYRLNVGGNFVPATGDTGMFRQWNPDGDFLLAAPFDTTLTGSKDVEVNYTSSDPAYIAPKIVSTSGRFLNYMYTHLYNMTWVFPVDFGFYYLLRLHFCETYLENPWITESKFSIFINNQAVYVEASVQLWAKGWQTAVSRIYITYVGDPDIKKSKEDLFLTLKPSRSLLSNAILSGLEIFKISRSDGSLNSPNPDLQQAAITRQHLPSVNKKRRIWPIGLAVAGGVVLTLAFLSFLIFKKREKVKDPSNARALCRQFSLHEIKCASHNFDDKLVIGVGGFCNVYKGWIDDNLKQVAIKRLSPSSSQGIDEFRAEIEMLSKLRHLHLVSLIGYCDESKEKILVYDYMSRGTLRDHLYKIVGNVHLSWKLRLQICIEVGRGLLYLHSGTDQIVIHRDIKSTNILLDEKWVAKVSDFGLSKMFPMDCSKPHISTAVKGTFGYLDPEYYMRHQLTEKSDVYSFGVVLLEILVAKPAITESLSGEHKVNLAHWAQECNVDGTLDQMIDPKVKGEIERGCLKKYIEVAFMCLNPKGSERPSMSDVVRSLEFARRLQEDAEMRIRRRMIDERR